MYSVQLQTRRVAPCSGARPSAMRPASAGTGQVTGLSGLASWAPAAPGGTPVGSRWPHADSRTPPETARAVAGGAGEEGSAAHPGHGCLLTLQVGRKLQ